MDQDYVSGAEMFDKFTPKAVKAIMVAQEEARSLGHNRVGSEQILIALTAPEAGLSSEALTNSGISLHECREAVLSAIGRGKDRVAVEIPFSDQCKRALELGWDEARQLKSKSIDTSHLLLGLMRIEDSTAVKILRDKGIDPDRVRKHILSALSH